MGTIFLIGLGIIIIGTLLHSIPHKTTISPQSETVQKHIAIPTKIKTSEDWIDSAIEISKTNIDTAISHYNESIKLKKTGTAFNNRAILKSEKNDYKGALDDFQIAISLEPEESIYYLNRGIVHWENDEEELALIDYKKSADLGNEEAIKELNEEEKIIRVVVTDCFSHSNGDSEAVIMRSDGAYNFVSTKNADFRIEEKLKLDKELFNESSWYIGESYEKELLKYLHKKGKAFKEKETIKFENNFFNDYGIDYLYHMTHINNLQSILKNGLQSNNTVKIESIIYNDISDHQVNDRRNKIEPIHCRSVHDYVPLYFNPKNPMLYVRKHMQTEIIILGINRRLLLNKNNIFTDGNASASKTKFFNDLKDINNLNWKCLKDTYWTDYVDGKRQKCAELLVYPQIIPSDIQILFASNIITVRKVIDIIGNDSKIKCHLKSDLFF